MNDDATDMTGAGQTAESIEHAVRQKKKGLSDSQRESLSLVLFPETHNETVMLCKKKRELHPLPVKITRKINSMLSQFQQMLAGDGPVVEADQAVLDHILAITDLLAEVYEWDDVRAALKEEEIMMGEMQALIVEQLALQEMNDFLLIPLRALVGTMQQVEIDAIRSQSIYTGLHS